MNVESLQIISKFMNDYEYEKAMELCEELLKKDNDNSHLWALKGCCLNHFEKYVEAMECYNRSLVWMMKTLLSGFMWVKF